MSTQIIIFLAFASFTLILNAAMLWFTYRTALSATTEITKAVADAYASESTRALLKTMESASSRTVELTDTLKTHLNNFEPVLARTQAKYEFKLAEADIHIEKSINTVVRKTQQVHRAVTGPAHRFGETLSGIHEVIVYLSGEIQPAQNAGDANSRQSQ